MKNKQQEILIVDDEKSLREMLSILLQREGYSVTQVENGKKALELVRGSYFDLIISDMKMPELGGLELLRHLREQDNDITVLMMTAFSSTEDAVEAMKLGGLRLYN